MVFAVHEYRPADSVVVIVPDDVGAFLRNLRSGYLCREFVRFPVIATAQDVFQCIFRGIVCIPHGLECCCCRCVFASVKIRFTLTCVDCTAVSVFAVVFAENLRGGIHVGSPAFSFGLCAHDGVQPDHFCAAPRTPEIECLVESRIADFDDRIVENVTPGVWVLRCRNVAAVARHHEFGAFEEYIAATTDKVYSSVNFATFPIGAAFFGVVCILTAQKTHVLIDELVACILLQCNLACSAARVIGASVLQGNVLHVHVLVAGKVQRCRCADAFGICCIPDNRLVNRFADNGYVRAAECRFAVFVTGDLGDVVFTIWHKENESLGLGGARRRCLGDSRLEITIDAQDKVKTVLRDCGSVHRHCKRHTNCKPVNPTIQHKTSISHSRGTCFFLS